jgi:hypothetical protein
LSDITYTGVPLLDTIGVKALMNEAVFNDRVFSGFSFGSFLQRRLSLAEQLGWLHPPSSINVVETQCVKAGAL